MLSELRQIRETALAEIAKATSADELERLRGQYLRRKGVLKDLTSRIPSLPEAERPQAGREANVVKQALTCALDEAVAKLGRPAAPSAREAFDITLPGRTPALGAAHAISRTLREIRDIFGTLGFEMATGPEVELEYYNFQALNIPLDHPSRDAFDTFYLENGALLRSHTSPVQARVMEKQRPPVRIITPGKVYRPDTVDASHSYQFTQVEGLMVDTNVTFADLKFTLTAFARAFFDADVKMRFRPSFFPFTEPSAEVDISCLMCGGKGCSACKSSGWMEVLGSGMVHPNVFMASGYDPEAVTGFAFGMGVERLTMLKLGIDDIRLFMENDIRFLSQFRGAM
jgi:phenylalanyl-tRNA synthetase alpha chain